VIVNIPPDLIELAENQRVLVRIIDVVVDDLIMNRSEMAGGVILGSPFTRLACKPAIETVTARTVEADSELVVIHQRGPEQQSGRARR